MKNLGTAVIGCGYWGPNITRNLNTISDLKYVCDLDPDLAQAQADKYPGVEVASIETILSDNTVNAVAIVTPPSTHLAIARLCLMAGKHIFVEKPLAASDSDASQLLSLSRTFSHLTCCVGHIFVFSPEILELKRLIDSGKVGKVKAINISRLNWGKFQECGVELDLLPHDLSIIQYLTGDNPVLLSRTSLDNESISVAGSSLYRLASGVDALVNYSWAHTEKVRKISILGTDGIIEYDMSKPKELAFWDQRIIGENKPGILKVLEVKDHSEPLRAELDFWLSLVAGINPEEVNRISFEHGYAVVSAI
jgi:predicted dehydrogenase